MLAKVKLRVKIYTQALFVFDLNKRCVVQFNSDLDRLGLTKAHDLCLGFVDNQSPLSGPSV